MIAERADALVLFGITGDLARKKLFSALYNLTKRDRLPTVVIGVASSELSLEKLRARAHEALVTAGVEIDEAIFSRLADSLRYVSGDYRDPDIYQRIGTELAGATKPVCYLAIPPAMFDYVIDGIASIDSEKGGRLVLEKPFGRDLASAVNLNRTLHKNYPEQSIYRIDHFLGKEPVQNLMVFRFANTILEPVWNRHYIDRIEVTMAESFGVEGRGRFYDGIGATRDVVQNHLLQMVSLLAMEPPVSDAPDALRDERSKVLAAMRPAAKADIVRGQYDGYRTEPGVAPDSDTETFVALKTEIDSWRWAGVPWFIVAGKHMPTTLTEAVVHFSKPPRPLFTDKADEPLPNFLRFEMKPSDRITLSVQAKRPGYDMISHPVALEVMSENDQPHLRDAYERLLDDALTGDMGRFARQDSVEAAWGIVDRILKDGPQAEPYQKGSWGPDTAKRFLR